MHVFMILPSSQLHLPRTELVALKHVSLSFAAGIHTRYTLDRILFFLFENVRPKYTEVWL